MKILLLIVSLVVCVSQLTAASSGGPVAGSRTQVFLPAEVDRVPKQMLSARLTYPAILKGEGMAGEVVVECVVDFNGEVRDPVAKSSTRKEFEIEALRAVSKWKFKPGRKGKENVNVRMLLTVEFPARKRVEDR